MDDGADIRFIDTHAEGDRRDDHIDTTAQKRVLYPAAALSREPRMVSGDAQLTRDLLGLFAGRRIDDGGAARGIAQDLRDDLWALARLKFGRLNGDIIAPEPKDEAALIPKAKLERDIILNGGGRGSGECHAGDLGEGREPLLQRAIIRPKIMSPLADTMRLIDRDQRRLPPLKEIDE